MMRYYIDLSGAVSREQLHDALEKALPLPDYYGRNLDAFYDILTSLPESFKNSIGELSEEQSEDSDSRSTAEPELFRNNIGGTSKEQSEDSDSRSTAEEEYLISDTLEDPDNSWDQDPDSCRTEEPEDQEDHWMEESEKQLDEAPEAPDSGYIFVFRGWEDAENGEDGDYFRRFRRMCAGIEREEENIQFIWE